MKLNACFAIIPLRAIHDDSASLRRRLSSDHNEADQASFKTGLISSPREERHIVLNASSVTTKHANGKIR